MAEPAQKRPKITPRNSENELNDENETPFAALQQLSKVAQRPTTPTQSSSTPHALSARRTPATNRTPRNVLAPIPTGRKTAPTTPHAIRAHQERLRGAVPLSARKRIANVRRGTPRDVLRDLSRVLARTTQPVEPSPQIVDSQSARRRARNIDELSDDEEFLRNRPRLSMALGEEDDSFHEAPRLSMALDVEEELKAPRFSLAMDYEDEELTTYSADMTAHSVEQGRERLQRDDLGRFNERELTEHGLGVGDWGEIDGNTTILGGPDGDTTMRIPADLASDGDFDEHTTGLGAFMHTIRSRPSDFEGRESPETEGEPTFKFRIPDRIRDHTLIEDEAAESAYARDETVQDMPILQAPDDDDDDDDNDNVVEEEPQSPTRYISDHESQDEDNAHEVNDEVSILARLRRESLEPALAILNQTTIIGDQNSKSRRPRERREMKVSKHGYPYPSLPPSVIKRLASSFVQQSGGNSKLSKDTLQTISNATDWFFEQISEDLSAYASHAGRKRIEEADVVALMKRQKMVTDKETVFSLANKMLPRELLQDVRMAAPLVKAKKTKKRRLETLHEDEE